jgi:hypothetical protein
MLPPNRGRTTPRLPLNLPARGTASIEMRANHFRVLCCCGVCGHALEDLPGGLPYGYRPYNP